MSKIVFRNYYRNIPSNAKIFNSVGKKHVWSDAGVVRSPFSDVDMPRVSVDQYVWRNLDKWPKKTAVVCAITNRSYTYEEMYKKSRIFAVSLRKKFKIKDSDVIALLSPNIPEFLIAMFGILAAGGVVTTLNPAYTAYEIQKQLDLSESKIIVAFGENVKVAKQASALCQRNIPIISINLKTSLQDGAISFEELIEDINADLDVLKEVQRGYDDISCLPYSSGTTGLPKGVELTNGNFIANCEQQNTECKIHTMTTESNQDSSLVILPMFHSYGLSIVSLHKLSVGIKLVTLPKFQPDTFLNALSEHKINILYLAPPLVLFLGTHSQVNKQHFEHLRSVISGGASAAEVDIFRLLERAKQDLHFTQAYGLTETGPLATIFPKDYKNMDYKASGIAIPNVQLRVIDEQLRNLGPNQVGELLIKGPNIMKGYKSNPEANKQALLEDGWFRSGDLAKIDEHGALTIVDRLKELIKVKGYQVAPAELEAVLKEHPAVLDAAVIGVPDPMTGESPKAFVIKNKKTDASEEDVMEFVKRRVAPFKKIKELKFVENIPKTASGKILRRLLKNNQD